MAQSHLSPSLLNTQQLASLRQARVALVYTEWNEQIVAEQIKGCKAILELHNAIIVREAIVPGSFELPFAIRHVWQSWPTDTDAPEAIIAFGAVIRGGTPHFEYVSSAVTNGITQLNLSLPVPVIFGVLTLNTEAEAWERLGGPHGHKGEEAAITALKMINLVRG